MNIAQRIRDARLMRGYTQEELAERLGVSKNQVSRYETGTNDPSAEALGRLVEILRVSADYLLGISDIPDPLNKSGLSERERDVISAWRHGDKLEAVRVLISEG